MVSDFKMPKRVAKRNKRAVKKKARKSENSSALKSDKIDELLTDFTNCRENNNNCPNEELVKTDWSKEESVEAGNNWSKEKEDSSGLIQLTSESESIKNAESDESSSDESCPMTDISIYDSTDETDEAISKEDEEIIRRNTAASDSCRHEIGEFCECSKSKDFRNLDGEPVAFGKTYHGMF